MTERDVVSGSSAGDVDPGPTIRLEIAALTPVRAGGSASIPLRVLNTGDIVVQFDVRIVPDDVAAWFAPIAPANLLPWQSSVVELAVTVPDPPELHASRVEFLVEVTCRPLEESSTVTSALVIEDSGAAARPGSPVVDDAAPDAAAPSARGRLFWPRLPWRRPRHPQEDTEWQAWPSSAPVEEERESLTVLSDHPVGRSEDELGFVTMAEQLARVVLSPATSTPFTVGIEGGWGCGKSSLMRLVEETLADAQEHRADSDAPVRVRVVRYNAWTAEGASALSGLIRSVLPELDPSVLRRLVRRGRSSWWVGLTVTVAATVLGVGHLVDVAWRRFGVDKETRNEIRAQLVGAMDDWVARGAEAGELRRLVVFVDDLDRCSPDNIREVFEAIRVYLDAPGFVFVIGYDAAVVNDRLLNSPGGPSTPWRAYLEKIIQVDFHLPSPDGDQLQRLARAWVRRSRAAGLLGEEELTLIAERSERNPRRLKRFLNAFVLARELDSATAELSPGEHIRIVLLQMYFPDFHRLLLDERETDPFADVQILARAAAPGREDDPGLRVALTEMCARRDIDTPSEHEGVADIVQRLTRVLPSPIVELSADRAFVTLVWKIGEAEQRLDLLRRLRERPVAVKVVPPSALVLVCHTCLSENMVGSPLCRGCGGLLFGGAPLGVVPFAAAHVAPSTDQSLLGRFLVLYDRSQTHQALAEALALRGATVAVTDTLRSVRAALKAHPDVSALVWISPAVVAEQAAAEHEEHLAEVVRLARGFSERLPVVAWGPMPSEFSGDRPGPQQHVLHAGMTEESLARTLADRGLFRQRRQAG